MSSALDLIRDRVALQAGITPQHIGPKTLGIYTFLLMFSSPDTGELKGDVTQFALLLRCQPRTVKRGLRNLVSLGLVSTPATDTYKVVGYPS